MKKYLKVLLSIFVCLMLATTAFAHSGRTDSSGGHKDNKNVSGLGYYHYHHGYGPHLHPNGVCPYTTNTNNSTSSNSKTPNNTKIISSNTTSFTDISAYINSNFIPSVNYKDYTYIVAEDLSNYGFDVVWDGDERSLKIKKNNLKEIKSVASSNFDETYGIETSDIKTYIYDTTSQSYKLINSYNIGGKTIIKFADIGQTTWNSQTRSTSILV